ncbi:HPr family phosphocarrier protein [Phytohabitans sp. ZYX-F-186]|uniref:Phosphocarrier protein HPr n=1 Tax=Phytohabitans maris TaxID=3071409 RepID=A0ABU0ZF66_9ACTN|nr:HPr family phosphocarrier protein [Phytohabitans sp. ZYX-F-186]MDQ7904597.1 HPr family phosphocarrier protein [Phytohabitans sp. ZYX-F-186]
MSVSSETAVVLPAHLHARPAGQVVQAAARFQAEVEIEYAGKVANARGVLAVMALGATAGTTVTLRASGPDAAEAVDAVAAVLSAAS